MRPHASGAQVSGRGRFLRTGPKSGQPVFENEPVGKMVEVEKSTREVPCPLTPDPRRIRQPGAPLGTWTGSRLGSITDDSAVSSRHPAFIDRTCRPGAGDGG